MTKELKPGDHVEWDWSQGPVKGTVLKKQTTRTKIKSHVVAASTENPEYIVKSHKTGKLAAHKPDELRKS